MSTLFAALVAVYPTEQDARDAIADLPFGTCYLGVWMAPTPGRTVFHLFDDDVTADDLLAEGFVQCPPR